MKISRFCRIVTVTILAAAGLGITSPPSPAADASTGDLPAVPLISIRAPIPETREPLCDPAICDAALPAPGVFVVSRRGGDLRLELSVFLTSEGTATEGADYPALPWNIFFAAGVDSVKLLVEAAYDKLPEGDETVVARLQPDPSLGPIERYRLDPAQAVAKLVIHDNETPPAPMVSIEATGRIAEESSFPFRRLAMRGRFTISRTGPTDTGLPVFVHYRGTALPDVDYPALPWLVRIPAGADSVELEVVPKPDDLREPIEIVEARISDCPPLTVPPLGMPCYELNIDPARSTARIFIRDDGITTASLELTAPKNGAQFPTVQAIPIAATAIDLDGAITHVEFFDGDKQIGASTIDFIRPPDPGTPIVHEFVWAGADAGAHALTARALNAAGNAATSAPVRIQVGEGLPIVSIIAVDAFAREGTSANGNADTAIFVVKRSGRTIDPLAVRFNLGGTALPGADYEAPASPLIIPAGQQSVRLVIRPVDDRRTEPVETVVVSLLANDATPAHYALGFPRRAAALIVDNDHARPPCLRLSDGLFNLCVATDIGGCVRVEVTRDFKEWTPLCTVPVTEGMAHFVDPDAPERPHQFYRLVPAPCEP